MLKKYSLFYAEFDDAIKEGDREHNLLLEILFILFKASNRKNYSIEALTHFYILLPPQLAQQLAWSRVVNTTGKPGRNKP